MSKVHEAAAMKPRGAIVYGPPRSRWGRFANRIRRLFGLEERMEAYAQMGFFGRLLKDRWMADLKAIDLDRDTITVGWTASGEFYIVDDSAVGSAVESEADQPT